MALFSPAFSRRDTLRRRLVLFSLALTLALLALVGAGVRSQFESDRTVALGQLQAQRQTAQRQLTDYLSRVQFQLTELERLAGDFLEPDPRHATQVCAEFLQLHPEFINIAVVDRAGLLRFSILFPVTTPPQDFSQVPGLLEILQSRDYRIGNAVRGMITGRWGCVAAKPLARQPELILTAPIDLHILSRQFFFAPDSPGLIVSVADRNDTIMLSSLTPTTRIGQKRPSARLVTQRLAAGRSTGEFVDVNGVPRTYAAGLLPATDWVVVVALPTAEIYRDAWRNLWRTLGAVSLVLAFCVLFVWRFTHAISRPVTALAEAARRQASGQIEATAPETGPVEIAETARAFNHMVATHHRNKALLRESEHRYHTVIDQTGQMVYDIDLATGRITWFGAQAVQQTTGYSLSEFPVTDLAGGKGFIHPDDRAAAAERFEQCLATGEPYHVEYRFRQKDGSYRSVEDHGVFLPDQTGRPGRMLGRMSDLSASKRAQEVLRQVIDLVPHFIFAKDADGRFVLVNKAVAEARGATPEEMIGKTDADFSGVPEEARWFVAKDRIVLESGQPLHIPEEPYTDRTGRTRLLSTVKIPFRFTSDGPPTVLGVAVDITELKQAAEERQRIEKKLLETQKLESLGLLAGGIAHDFNNLLTGILGNAGLARHQAPADWPGLPVIAGIEKSALRAAELCQQMLAYSGKGHFRLQCVDLNELLRDTLPLLSLSVSKKARLHCRLAPSLPAIEVDVTQIRQVVMNLAINASEALGETPGTITLGTHRLRLDAGALAQAGLAGDLTPGEYVCLEVADDGEGMTPETQSLIFDPFFTTKFTGRGLGLAAVHGIVRGHQGGIQVTSERNRGSTFRIYLPAAAGVPGPLVAPASDSSAWRGSGRLLVIDDDASVRLVAAEIARQAGFIVDTAADGLAGLEAFQRQPEAYAAVLLDLTMPQLDGVETFRRLRQLKPGVRVVLMSGYNQSDAVNRFPGLALTGFLQKPFTVESLAAALRHAIEPSSATPG